MVFAICISDSRLSCIRAPPEAVKQMNGTFCSSAFCAPRAKRSPTTEPIEPPMNENSKHATTTGSVWIAPPMTTIASVSSVSSIASFRRSGYLRLSLNFSASTGSDFLADFIAAFRIEQAVEPLTRADAHVMVALRANMQIGLDVVAIQHGFARRALDPQAFRNALAAFRIGLFDFRRQQFVEPAHIESFSGYVRANGGTSPPFTLQRQKYVLSGSRDAIERLRAFQR